MPLAEEVLLKKREGIFADISGSSRPKPRLKRISSGSSSYKSSNSETLGRDTKAVSHQHYNLPLLTDMTQ